MITLKRQVLFIRQSTNPGPRVARMAKFFSSKQYVTSYLAPVRGDELENSYNRPYGNLGRFKYFEGRGFFKFVFYLISINLRISWVLLVYRRQIHILHLSDLEVSLLAIPLARLLKIRTIYNIHDNFYQRHNFGNFVGSFLKYIESLYIFIANITVVPEGYRRDAYPEYLHQRIVLVKNCPDFDVFTDRMPFSGEKITIFYGGWISAERSLNLSVQLSSFLVQSGYKVKMLACGWGSKDYLSEIAAAFSHCGAEFEYLGSLGQQEAITYLQKSDISIAYYSPDKIINLFAASNKIPEILGSNTVLITNSQIEVSKLLHSAEVSLQFDQEISEIGGSLVELISSPEKTEALVARSRNYYLENYSSVSVRKQMEKMYCEIGF